MALLALAAGPALCSKSHQYTWSLSLFLVPVAAMVRWLKRNAADWSPLSKTLRLAICLLTPTGFILNLCFADLFFVWPNQGAVLGLTIPSLGLFGPKVPIPVEEFCFYTLGFAAVLLTYAWADRALFPCVRLEAAPKLMRPFTAALVALGVCAAGFAAQPVLNPQGTMPGYLCYLALVPLFGTLVLYPRVAHRVNGAALTFTLVATLAVSITWEASLAVPGGWWGYRPESMVGLNIDAWAKLPLEAVLVWVLVAFASAVTFEAVAAGVRNDPLEGQNRPRLSVQIADFTPRPLGMPLA
jgi:hypothetical protein